MKTFFELCDVNKGTCFGCAATCAIQKLTGVNYDADTIMVKFVFNSDHSNFEKAIDGLRKGNLNFIFSYFKKDIPGELFGERSLIILGYMGVFWHRLLPAYEDLLSYLKERDI